MAVKKSPRTPSSTKKAASTVNVPQPSAKSGSSTPRRPGRKNEPRKLTPLKSSASPETSKLTGKSSPYFRKPKVEESDESDQDDSEPDEVDEEVTPTRRSGRPSRKSTSAKKQSTSVARPKGRASNGKTTKGKVANGRGHGKGTRKAKDPADVTGLTETESDDSSSSAVSEDEFAPSSDAAELEEEFEADEEESEVDSEDLDDDEYGGSGKKRKGKKTVTPVTKSVKRSKPSNGVKVEEDDDEEEDLADVELEEGQEIAGRIYPAPKTGQGADTVVPPGRISHNTFKFLKNLQIPERNDRDWFRSHEPAFRQAEKEWQAFVSQVQMRFHENDNQIPILPPKDLIHRIYRDIRFSSDKTPYKKNFSLSTSRSGRKGVWAGYYLAICPNNQSLIASGVWCPAKNEMQTIRHHLQETPQRFRDVIENKEFVNLFGPAKPHPKGKRQSVFGHEDQLKVAPKGVDKGHKDIDLLKLRSVAVVHHFSDEEVLAEDFQDTVADVVRILRPFVHVLNEFIALPP